MEMKKKYEKPAMRVCELKHRCRLLAGSETRSRNNSLNDYNKHDYYEE